MPSPLSLSKLRSSRPDTDSEEHNWGVDPQGRFYERRGRTKLSSQVDPTDKRYVAPLSTKDLSPVALQDLVKVGLGSLKGFKELLYCSDRYFHARYTHWVVHATDDIEVYVGVPPGVIHFRCSTKKDALNGFSSRHRHRITQLVNWLQMRIHLEAEKELAQSRTNRIHEWDCDVGRLLPNGHFEPDELDDPTSVIEPEEGS